MEGIRFLDPSPMFPVSLVQVVSQLLPRSDDADDTAVSRQFSPNLLLSVGAPSQALFLQIIILPPSSSYKEFCLPMYENQQNLHIQ